MLSVTWIQIVKFSKILYSLKYQNFLNSLKLPQFLSHMNFIASNNQWKVQDCFKTKASLKVVNLTLIHVLFCSDLSNSYLIWKML